VPAETLSERSNGPTRRRRIAQPQLPFVLAVAVAAIVVIARGGTAPAVLATLSLVVFASLAVLGIGLLVPWQAISPHWAVVLPLLDVVIVAIYNTSPDTRFHGSGLLIVSPVLWMVYGFSPRVLPLTFGAPLLVSVVPYLVAGVAPDAGQWAEIVGFATLVLLLAGALAYSAARFRHGLRTAAEASTLTHDFLAEVQDREITLNAVLDTVDASIVLFDPHGGVILTNASGRELSEHAGGSLDDIAEGLPLLWMMDGVTRPSIDVIVRAEKGADGGASLNTFLVGPPANQRAVRVRSRQVLRPSGELLGSVVISHDVTDLVDAVHVRDEFLMSVSHELRTPLTSIIGYLELIEDTVDSRALGFNAELAVVQRNSARLLGLITDLMATAEERVALLRRPVDLAQLLDHALETAGPNAVSSRVTVSGGPFAPLSAEIDRRRIAQVFDNVLSNAVKYTPAGGTVHVSLEAVDDGALVSVTDTGVGMSLRDQRQIFTRFFRADTARRGAVPGVGVGLSIVKTYVEAHNGTVSVSSVLGVGTTMRVWLPITHKKEFSETVTSQFSRI